MTHKFIKIAVTVLLIQAFVAVSAEAVYLSVNKIGEGTTSPAAGGAYSYSFAKRVTVSATPAPGWAFDHWEGAFYSTSSSRSFYMWSNYRITAVFRPITPTAANNVVRFVGRYDSNFHWNEYNHDTHFGWDKYTLTMVSQQWRNSSEVDRPLWEHDLGIIYPWFSTSQVVYLVNGGSNDPEPPEEVDSAYAAIAWVYGITYAQLDQVPNEPLYFTDEGGLRRSEDEILAYSLDKYLDTGDENWPVHMAMAKAAIRGMDVVQECIPGLSTFLMTGGSKRGWTTYLASAVGDSRIRAIAPLSIDIPNIQPNMRHHWECYGFWAPSIQDYSAFDLFCRMGQPSGQNLLTMIDPYTYFSKYTMPKFVAVSAGDQFFVSDSSQFYYSQLPGQKWLRYTVNTDHSQGQDATAITTLLTWADAILDGAAIPSLSWTFEADGSIRVVASQTPSSVKLWQATNAVARDFRLESIGAAWTSTTLANQGGNTYVGNVPQPPQGWTAYVVEADFGNGLILTSEVRVKPDTLPFAGTACL